tara:strand:+ start:1954 stop:2577 length:624 start_codon:yes stop_codon:yes gene_type:complete
MTWKEDLKREIITNGLDKRPFTLKELYISSEESLKNGKDSNSVRASIRATLQNLRDEGFINFLDKGLYQVNRENTIQEEEYTKVDKTDTTELDETENEERIRRRVETPKVGIQINFMLSKRQKGKCRNPKCFYKQIENFEWHNIPFENDHRKRVCDGGQNDINNRQLLCPTCHKIKTINEQRVEELSNSEKEDLLILQKPYEENEPI